MDEARDALPLLYEHGLALHMAWNAPGDARELYDLARSGEREGVPVRPWILLEEADGYWPGSTNAEAFAALARAVMDRWDAEGLAPTTLLVDMEMHRERADQLQAMLEQDGLDLPKFIAFFQEGVDRDQFAAATQTYAALADEAHERGWKVLCTTLPNVLDDYGDGDDSLRQALGIPVEGIDFDVITFQAYTTLFSGLFASILDGKELTSYMVYSYAQTAIEQFGSRAGLDIGTTGTGVSDSPVYPSPTELRADLEAGAAAGIPPDRINVFSLGGILDRPEPDAWLQPLTESPAAPPEDEGTASIRSLIATLDAAN